MDDDTEMPDEVVTAAEHEIEEAAQSFERPLVGAVSPIRDPGDEPFVFRFEVGPAILNQLLEKLRRLDPCPLVDAVNARHPGFYQLFLDNSPVYIGKTARPIGNRIAEHIKKITGRIALDRVSCKFAYVEDPSLVDVAEGALINFFSANEGGDWNRSGFGSKVTGYNRGRQSGSDWESQFPPDLGWRIPAGSSQPITLLTLIKQVARSSPITLSLPKKYQSAFNASHSSTMKIPLSTRSFIQWVRLIEQNLNAGWKIDRQASAWYIEPR